MMRDFNFFSPFIKQNKSSNDKNLYLAIGAAAIVVLILSVYTFNAFKIGGYKKQIAKNDAFLNSPEIQEKIKEVEEKKRKNNIMTNYHNYLTQLDNQFYSMDLLKTYNLQEFTSSIPQNIFFTNFIMFFDSMQIQGYTDDKAAIAELEHNLKQLSFMEYVHVNTITKNDKGVGYIFTMTGVLKEVKP